MSKNIKKASSKNNLYLANNENNINKYIKNYIGKNVYNVKTKEYIGKIIDGSKIKFNKKNEKNEKNEKYKKHDIEYILDTKKGIYNSNKNKLWTLNLGSIYHPKKKINIIEAQKKSEPIPFNIMIKVMRRRIEEEKIRLENIKLLGFTKNQSNNSILNEKKYLSESKTINKNELNSILSSNKIKRDAYINTLKFDLKEYFLRYHEYISKLKRNNRYTKNNIDAKIKKVEEEIDKCIQDNIEIKHFSNLKKEIQEILKKNHMFPISFYSFRTRKVIKELKASRNMYNANINHTYMETNNNRIIKTNLKKNIKNFNNINDIIDFLGINKIVRFDGNIKEIPYNRTIYTEIAELIIQKYMYEINIPIEELDDPLFYKERNLYKLEITEKILSSFNSRKLYSSFFNKKKFSAGYGGIIFRLDDVILKYEDLRIGQLNENYIKNYDSYYSPSVSYIVNNYVVFELLIQLLIQNYLYKLDKRYVPEFISYSVSYNDGLSLTRMRVAFEDNNKNKNIDIFIGNFYDFIIKESNTENTGIFIKNLLLILKEICIVLDFYQKRCYFVHGDLNIKNIMIKCEFDKDHLIINIKLKFIDFRFSSIILNIRNKLKILKVFGFELRRVTEEFNPYISSYWNKIDILYFVFSIFFNLKKNAKINENINIFLSKILKIFNIKEDFYNKLVNNTKEDVFNKYHSYIYSLKKEEKFSNIFIKNKNQKEEVFKNFIPSNLLIHLDKFINI